MLPIVFQCNGLVKVVNGHFELPGVLLGNPSVVIYAGVIGSAQFKILQCLLAHIDFRIQFCQLHQYLNDFILVTQGIREIQGLEIVTRRRCENAMEGI